MLITHTHLGIGLTVESRACDWAGGWVCPREGSWSVCPPVWMCLSRSGCGCTKRPVCVVCWRTRAPLHHYVSCLGSWPRLLERAYQVTSALSLGFLICCVRGVGNTGRDSPARKGVPFTTLHYYEPGMFYPLTHLFAFPEKVLMTSGYLQGQAQVSHRTCRRDTE